MKKAKLLYILGSVAIVATCLWLITPTEKKPLTPTEKKLLTLPETIVENIKNHPNDWKLIEFGEIVDTTVTKLAGALMYFSGADTLKNDVCGIKIICSHYNSKMVEPDTFLLNDNQMDVITSAYLKYIISPRFQAQEDSAMTARSNKEKEIVKRLCSN